MSEPRQIVPGTTYFVTRRTVGRQYLFTPDEKAVLLQAYWYLTAVLASELGILVHAAQVLSTHMHEVLTDTRGVLPDFLSQRNRLFANLVKRFRKWPEEVFSAAGVSAIVLRDEEVVLRHLGYTLANAVEAGLVCRPEDWPGVTVAATDIGTRVIRVRRPNIYLSSKNSRWPEFAEIEITIPPCLAEMFGAIEARRLIVSAVSLAVEKARSHARRAGRLAGKVERLFHIAHTRRATTPEPVRERKSFVAAADDAIERRALDERRQFLIQYRIAREEFRAGRREVVFPFGTWKMRRDLGVAVGGAPAERGPASARMSASA